MLFLRKIVSDEFPTLMQSSSTLLLSVVYLCVERNKYLQSEEQELIILSNKNYKILKKINEVIIWIYKDFISRGQAIIYFE